MSNLTNAGQQYVVERAWRGGAAISELFLGLTNATLAKGSVLSAAFGGEPLGMIAAPGAPTAALAGLGTGNLSNGAYKYKIVFVTLDGETQAGVVSGTVTVTDYTTDGQIALSAIPVGPLGVTERRIYRTTAGGSSYLLLDTIADNTTTTYTDDVADGSLGAAAPSVNTTMQKNAPAVPSLALAGAGAGNLGTGAYQYRYTYVTNSGETEGGTSDDVTVSAPGSDGKVNVTIAVGPYGVTSRKIYRTVVGGSVFKLLTTVADNTTTLYLDNIADGSLGANIVNQNTTAPNGYIRKPITQDATGFPTSALDSGDWALITQSNIWAAAGGTIGPLKTVFLTDKCAGSAGVLLGFWDLLSSKNMADTESFTWAGKIKQK